MIILFVQRCVLDSLNRVSSISEVFLDGHVIICVF